MHKTAERTDYWWCSEGRLWYTQVRRKRRGGRQWRRHGAAPARAEEGRLLYLQPTAASPHCSPRWRCGAAGGQKGSERHLERRFAVASGVAGWRIGNRAWRKGAARTCVLALLQHTPREQPGPHVRVLKGWCSGRATPRIPSTAYQHHINTVSTPDQHR